MAASQTTRQAMWLSSIFRSIGVPQMKPLSYMMTIKILYLYKKNTVFHTCMKHIEIHYHLVQEKTEESFVKLTYCNTKNMVINILIKGLSIDKHEYFEHLMSVTK